MNKIPKAPKQNNPVGIDRIISHLQDELINKIGWLDYAFGRAQRLVTKRDRKEYYYPGVYVGRNEYLNVLPGQDLGNRVFFVVNDPSTINDYMLYRYNTIKTPVSLILWYDLTKIYRNTKDRNTEEIKRQIMRVITNMIVPDGAKIEMTKIYEQANNIFSDYSLREIDTQYLMHPFAGLRIDFTITYREQCG